MGFKIVKTEGGKTNWGYFRHIFWTALIVWALGVRLAGVDPFDDLLTWKLTIGTLLDVMVLIALWLFVWLVLYPARPRWGSST